MEAIMPRQVPIGRIDAWVAGGLAAAALLVFCGSLDGSFVYDDRKQILENHLIREPASLGRALVSDVWAFKGERIESWSNYWRPSFVLWLALENALFGVERPFYWHLANCVLHALATLLAYRLLRRLGVAWPLAAGIGLLFAVHPAHVESVAWISGAPDLLMTVALLASLNLLVEPGVSPPRRLAAVALFAVGLGAKEAAVVFPLIVAVAAIEQGRRPRQAVAASLPFVAVGVVWFVARWSILGRLEVPIPWRLGPVELLLSLPSVSCFYLRQALFPFWLGPSYPLRAVSLASAGAWNLWIPAAVLLAVAALAWRVRRRPLRLLGLALFILPLAPALNLNAYIQEQLVHDRYLYLPLLGILSVLLLELRPRLGLLVAAGLSMPLAAQSVDYTEAWGSEIQLWSRGVRSDPSSSFNHAQLGDALLRAGRTREAREALDAALAIRPVTSALLNRARLARHEGRLQDAEADLRRVLREQPDNPTAIEQLALVYQQGARPDAAMRVLDAGRRAVPYRWCSFTTNLAVLEYLGGLKAEALRELQAASARVAEEPTPACQMSLFHLGSLLLELGRPLEAKVALEGYLANTETAVDATSRKRRELALAWLRRL
jgi:protein O-mannosyl-transferase